MKWPSQDTPAILFGVRTAIEAVLAILFLGSIFLFWWGFFRFKFSKDPAAKTKAKDRMERGAIGAIAMAVTWGAAVIIASYLGIPADR